MILSRSANLVKLDSDHSLQPLTTYFGCISAHSSLAGPHNALIYKNPRQGLKISDDLLRLSSFNSVRRTGSRSGPGITGRLVLPETADEPRA